MRPTTTSTSLTLVALALAGCDDDGRALLQPTPDAGAAAGAERLVDGGTLRAIFDAGLLSGPSPAAGSRPAAVARALADDASCTVIDFEGAPDLGPVGSIGDAAFGASWIGLVDQDAGGSGPFANEPSPSTVALQLDANDVDVTLAVPVAYVSLYYSALAEALPLVLQGVDDSDAVVASAEGTVVGANSDPPPCDGDPEGWFCGWASLEISAADPTISRIRIQGPPDTETAWAIDDMMLCDADPGAGGDPGGEDNVLIDIKPGSEQNTVNPKSKGKLKVALLGDEGLDVGSVDPSSITLGDGEDGDTPIARKGGDRPMAQIVDTNGDGYPDLMMHFDIGALVDNGDLTWETTQLVLLGSTWEPTVTEAAAAGVEAEEIRGSDLVRVVPGSESDDGDGDGAEDAEVGTTDEGAEDDRGKGKGKGRDRA